MSAPLAFILVLMGSWIGVGCYLWGRMDAENALWREWKRIMDDRDEGEEEDL